MSHLGAGLLLLGFILFLALDAGGQQLLELLALDLFVALHLLQWRGRDAVGAVGHQQHCGLELRHHLAILRTTKPTVSRFPRREIQWYADSTCLMAEHAGVSKVNLMSEHQPTSNAIWTHIDRCKVIEHCFCRRVTADM